MDKPSIVVPSRLQIKAAALIAAILLIAGCAGMPPDDEAPEAAPEAVPEAPVEPSDDLLITDPDVMFHIMAAERLGATGDYEEALEHYLSAAMISEDPEIAEQVTRLGVSLGEWPTVTRGALRWLELDPNAHSARQIAVVGLLRQEKDQQAAELLAEAIDTAEDADQAWRGAINLLASAGTDESARSAFDALLEQTGMAHDPGGTALQESRLAWQLEREDEAFEWAERAAELDDRRETRVWAAQLAVANDDMETALGHYRAARRADPDDLELALSEAEVLRQMERIDEALEALEELPESAEILYTRGSYLHAAKRFDEAREAWRALTRIDAVDPDQHAYYTALLAELLEQGEDAVDWYARVETGGLRRRADLRRAALLGDQGRVPEAQEVLRSLRLEGNEMLEEQAWLTESQILADAGLHRQAKELLSEALVEMPGSIALLYNRALTAVEMDDLELAEQDLRAILQVDPESAIALNALGYTLTDRTSRHREALRLIERAYELEPDNPAIQDSMGWVHFNLGQPERALPFLREALKGDYHPEIAAHLGEVLIALGEEQEGWEVLDQASEDFPDDDYLAATIERLSAGRAE